MVPFYSISQFYDRVVTNEILIQNYNNNITNKGCILSVINRSEYNHSAHQTRGCTTRKSKTRKMMRKREK